MAAHTDLPELGADVLSLLAQLRRRIRMYVWVEGLSLALLWLGATFWIGLAIDYLPVLLGALPGAAFIPGPETARFQRAMPFPRH